MEDKDLTFTVITELEDKTALEDIRDVKGRGNKTPAAVRHFNDFLVLCCQEKNAPIATANDLPCYGLGDIGDYQKWWDDLFGKFFHYVTFHAHKYFDKSKPLVSYEAATGCGSAMKSFFENGFHGKPPLTVFTTSWRSPRNTHSSLHNNSSAPKSC